ncbi:hypothetical protein RND81_08G190000 [Saponaria officinalis]|uniref:KIB1-4 beta-propeller domain-containing protein n=1 Tax=Saponaria officinalis TaxID=3572 RepID=A0AAW1J8L4_SAPOF
MSLKNNKGECELWDLFENRTHLIKTPHSPEYISTIEFCEGGCLLMRIDDESLQYFNPFTGTKWEYPPRDMIIWGYAFSTACSSPDDDNLTIGIFGYDNFIEIACFKAASEEWDYHPIIPNEDIGIELNLNSTPRYHDGAFYFIGVKGNLGILRMLGEKWSWKVYDSPLAIQARSKVNSSYIVELDGQLTSVLFQEVGKKVQMFRFENLEERWVELHDLGEHVLFLSPASSFSIVEKDRAMRNRIYLSKRVGNGIVYYSPETRSTTFWARPMF